jgi:hypothetical protein
VARAWMVPRVQGPGEWANRPRDVHRNECGVVGGRGLKISPWIRLEAPGPLVLEIGAPPVLQFLIGCGRQTLPSVCRSSKSGRLAQLGERRVRNAEVASSILAPSTNLRSHLTRRLPAEALAKAGHALPIRATVGRPSLALIPCDGCRAEGGPRPARTSSGWPESRQSWSVRYTRLRCPQHRVESKVSVASVF